MLRSCLSAAVLVTLCGCGSEGRVTSGVAGSGLIPVDSVLLEEADSLYVGEVLDLGVDPLDGSIYVADNFAQHAVRFDRSGRALRVYGSPGGGPGEFRQIGDPFVLDDSTVVVPDYRKHSLFLFDRGTGAYRRSVRYRGWPDNAQVENGTVWLGIKNSERNTGIAAWDVDQDSMRYLGPVPAEFIQSRQYAGTFPYTMVAVWSDSVLLGYYGRNELVLLNDQGAVLDTIQVPVTRRRGVPDDMPRRLTDKEATLQSVFGAISTLVDLHRAPGGDVLLFHVDLDVEGGPPKPRVRTTSYVSVLSRDRARACVDMRVPNWEVARAVPAFRGDTLFVLDRKIDGESVETWVRMYTVDQQKCHWTPVNTVH